jgi:hypothetical protein
MVVVKVAKMVDEMVVRLVVDLAVDLADLLVVEKAAMWVVCSAEQMGL